MLELESFACVISSRKPRALEVESEALKATTAAPTKIKAMVVNARAAERPTTARLRGVLLHTVHTHSALHGTAVPPPPRVGVGLGLEVTLSVHGSCMHSELRRWFIFSS